MSSKNVQDELKSSLIRLHQILSSIYQNLQEENGNHKLAIIHLSKLYSSLERSQENNEDLRMACSPASPAIEKAYPELQLSQELLIKCKTLKNKFHAPASNTNSDPSEVYKKHKRKPMSGDKAKTQRNSSKPPEFCVITENKLHQLTKMLSQAQENKNTDDYQSKRHAGESGSKSLKCLLEKNKYLKMKAKAALNEVPCNSSLLFQHHFESSLCLNSSQLSQVGNEEGTPARNGLTRILDKGQNFVYSDVKDVVKVCSLLSDLQFLQLRNLVHTHIQKNISPILNRPEDEHRIPFMLLQSFLDLGVPQ